MGSAGMMGKSSGDGKCVMPKVCQRTMSVFSIDCVAVRDPFRDTTGRLARCLRDVPTCGIDLVVVIWI